MNRCVAHALNSKQGIHAMSCQAAAICVPDSQWVKATSGAVLAWLSVWSERGADLHTAQLMPLPLTVSRFSEIQIGFTFLGPAHPGSPGRRAVKRVCVCEWKQQSLVWADNTGNDSLKTHGSSLRPLYLHSWLGAVGFHWSKIINSPHALGWRTFMMTCLRWILGYMRLEIWCKIGLSADWCLCTALCTRSGACYYWIECPRQQQLLTRNGELTAKTFSTVAYTVSILLDDKHFQLWIWPNIS